MKTRQLKITALIVITAMLLTSFSASAAGPSPFVGHWQGIDTDGSDIRLTIGGPPNGPFQITWTESYISFCDSEAGILRGTGEVNPEDPYLLEADLTVECFTTGASTSLHLSMRYHPSTGALSTIYPGGLRVVFTHPGKPHDPLAPLNLRANYQENWVEGFYPEGYMVWIAVTESDGVTIKATAEVVTEPVPFWDGEIGFSTLLTEWDPGQPEIEPNDWVYGWVDNGASAQMRVGEIIPTVDLENDLVQGTIAADWFAEEVFVICTVRGYDGDWLTATVMPDDSDSFTCDFGGRWNIMQGDTAEVWYHGPDGHAVGHYIHIPNPRFTVFPEWEWFDGYDWPDGVPVDITVTSKSECTTEGTSYGGFFNGSFPEVCDVEPNDEVVFDDGTTTRLHSVRHLSIASVDEGANSVYGVADTSSEIHIWVHEHGESEMVFTTEGSTWTADFNSVGFDLLSGMCGRAEIRDSSGNSTAADWCVPVTISVTSVEDTLADDGACTLREAIIAANTNSPSGESEGECPAGREDQTDTIILAAGKTYSLTLDNTDEDEARDGDLDIWDNSAELDLILVVDGGGSAIISQDASSDDRVFTIHGASVEMEGLTITGGSNVYAGGGIENGGRLVMHSCSVSENIVDGDGGGLINYGSLEVHSSEITGNSSTWGGGILNAGEMALFETTIAANIAANEGGGIGNYGSAIAYLENSTLSGNSASSGGGIINWTWEGNDGQVEIISSDVANNIAPFGVGGGIENYGNLLITDGSMISQNQASDAGGIFNNGSLTIEGSTLSMNAAISQGGALYNDDAGTVMLNSTSVVDGTARDGGGLFNLGDMTVDTCSIDHNTADLYGGGVFNWTGGQLTISNSMISMNIANEGGGLHNKEGSETHITGTTISENHANEVGGGFQNWGILHVADSVLSSNTSDGEGDAIISSVDEEDATSISGSCIISNGDTAVFNSSEYFYQSAIGNWWGDASGPSGVGAGSGDSVGNYFDFSEWLTEPPLICAPSG